MGRGRSSPGRRSSSSNSGQQGAPLTSQGGRGALRVGLRRERRAAGSPAAAWLALSPGAAAAAATAMLPPPCQRHRGALHRRLPDALQRIHAAPAAITPTSPPALRARASVPQLLPECLNASMRLLQLGAGGCRRRLLPGLAPGGLQLRQQQVAGIQKGRPGALQLGGGWERLGPAARVRAGGSKHQQLGGGPPHLMPGPPPALAASERPPPARGGGRRGLQGVADRTDKLLRAQQGSV
jgi:hypothetical protein